MTDSAENNDIDKNTTKRIQFKSISIPEEQLVSFTSHEVLSSPISRDSPEMIDLRYQMLDEYILAQKHTSSSIANLNCKIRRKLKSPTLLERSVSSPPVTNIKT
jgi:hypothetical protein